LKTNIALSTAAVGQNESPVAPLIYKIEALRELEKPVRDLECLLGKKTMEAEKYWAPSTTGNPFAKMEKWLLELKAKGV
jgi:hypothetical protein